jgi:hypothetical protein
MVFRNVAKEKTITVKGNGWNNDNGLITPIPRILNHTES